jgi:hypothetical protein
VHLGWGEIWIVVCHLHYLIFIGLTVLLLLIKTLQCNTIFILQRQSVQWTVLHTWQLLVTLSAAVCAEETGSPGGWWRSTLHRCILVPTLLHLSDHTKHWLNKQNVQTIFFSIKVNCIVKLPIGKWTAAMFSLWEDPDIQEVENEAEGQYEWIYTLLS